MSTSISCSLVVPTRHRATDLERCLTAVTELAPRPDEIVVVDNSEGDEATRRVAQRSGAQYVREPIPGAARARNAGSRQAIGEVVAFLDDDMVPLVGWLEGLLAPFADPSVVATTGRVVNPHGVDGDGGARPGTRELDLGSEGMIVDRTCRWWFEMTNFGGVGYGGIMAIRRSAFETWPGFHPMIGRGTAVPAAEDNYAFFELIKLGGRIAYCPGAVASNAEPAARAAVRADSVGRVSEASAHIALLLAEQPGLRLRTLRFAMGTRLGKRRPWRGIAPSTDAPRPTRGELVRGMARGPTLYVRSRLVSRRDPLGRWQRSPPFGTGPVAGRTVE